MTVHLLTFGGPVAWPPRSPDLTSLDLFFWGHMKNVVYETPINTEEELVARIVVAAESIRETDTRGLRTCPNFHDETLWAVSRGWRSAHRAPPMICCV